MSKIKKHRTEKLSVSELRLYKGFEHVSEEEGQSLLDFMEDLTIMIYQQVQQEK